MSDKNTAPFAIKAAPFIGSGHHFYFLPFEIPDDEISETFKSIKSQGNCPWAIAVDKLNNKKLLWLRARFCHDGERFGIRLVLDTTVGQPTQGWPVTPVVPASKDLIARFEQRQAAIEPYIFREVSDAPSVAMIRNVRFDFKTYTGFSCAADVRLELEFPPSVADPLDVDLIIDFGNTRTVVLGLENNKAANGYLSQVCKPIEFWPRTLEPTNQSSGWGPSTRNDIIDSWFVLSEPLFSCLEPPSEDGKNESEVYTHDIVYESRTTGMWPMKKTEQVAIGYRRLIPHGSVQVSPAVLGQEAAPLLVELPLELGGNAFLSSPKRYSWDTDPVGQLGHAGRGYWTMHVQPWNRLYPNFEEKKSSAKLAATVLLLMDESGADWKLSNGPTLPSERDSATARPPSSPARPAYPRSDALTWAALTVLENSYRHIMSDEWRRQMQHQFVPRRLRNVVVTFPSGWTGQELETYRAKWQKAVDIFTATRLRDLRSTSDGGDKPTLVMEIDEAVASQLPIIFGEIVRLGNIGENWVELVGRGSGTNARARIMNLDIGGGTSDVAVIEYHDEILGHGVALNTELLFKDSSTVAGDALVRGAIERVLLPAINRSLDESVRERFSVFLKSAKQEHGARWNRCTRQVLIPIVQRWLTDMSAGVMLDPHTSLAPTPLTMVPGPAAHLIGEFNKICSHYLGVETALKPEVALNYDQDRLVRCVDESFQDHFISIAKIAEGFDCDMLIVSGKPSELPRIKELILQHIPLPPGRIVFVHNYDVGPWYPVSPDGHVRDAKTVTVAGAALYQAVKQHLLPDWIINPSKTGRFAGRNFWGKMPAPGEKDFTSIILMPDADTAEIKIMVGARIGRRLLPTRTKPDPVYKLRWTKKGLEKGVQASAHLAVTFERCLTEIKKSSSNPMESISETLKLTSVTGDPDGKPILLEDIELQLCTLDADDYWIDSGIFHMEDINERFFQ